MPLEYREFNDFMNLKGTYAKMRPGSHVLPACSRYFWSLVAAMITYFYGKIINMDDLTKPEMGQQPFWYRIFFMLLCA